MEQVIKISPNGDSVTCLFDGENFLLNVLGKQTVVRASNIQFDNQEKKWFMFLRLIEDGRIKEHKLSAGFDCRKDAIAYEVKVCGALLEAAPKVVDHLIETHDQQFTTSK